MSKIFHALCLFALMFFSVGSGFAQDLNALARFDVSRSRISGDEHALTIKLAISQPVPFRVFTLTKPARFVADFREIDWGTVEVGDIMASDAARGVRFGQYRDGWSRMVIDLNGPMAVDNASIFQPDDGAGSVVSIQLKSVPMAQFVANSGAPDTTQPSKPLPNIARTSDRLMVVIDPGHGGIDPGAQRDGVNEADLMLGFGRALKEELLRNGHFDVLLTRDRDEFIPLENRVSIARAAQADVFISLHADILEIGAAAGATVYTLSEKSENKATEVLVQRHDRSDILAGVDLAQNADEIATVLIDLARVETAPRSEKLATQLVEGLRASIGRMHRKPQQSGNFAVLRAADFPSVLIELGFMSNDDDFLNLGSRKWRARAALGIRIALEHWATQDVALSKRMRH